jgi:CRISPR-associated protein Cas6
MAMIDLHFPVIGTFLPTDHAYGLYSALTELIPTLHDGLVSWRVAGIAGHFAGNGLLRLDSKRSRLRFRLAAENIPTLLPLAGKALAIAGHAIRVGVPWVRPLIPAPALIARTVTIKGFVEPGPFLEAVRRQLDALDVKGEAGIPLTKHGKREGKPHRQVLRIKEKQVVAFAVQVTGLDGQESITLQEHGLGGRGRMGCGFFVPLIPR